jgi:hypothetical protein
MRKPNDVQDERKVCQSHLRGSQYANCTFFFWEHVKQYKRQYKIRDLFTQDYGMLEFHIIAPNDYLSAIAEMPEPDRTICGRLHAVILANGPDLSPKTWYGMPAYTNDDKVICFFRTIGFNQGANFVEAAM